MQVVIVTGLSGAGKSQASICLEDLGYYCIDNMPPSLMMNFLELTESGKEIEKAAFIMDIRGGQFFKDLKKALNDLKNRGIEYNILFLEASDDVLIRRYNETRRMHPLSETGSPIDGIKKERELMKELRSMADYIIDTSNMKTMQLRSEINEIFTGNMKDELFTINIQSFGYKHGIPLEADMVFDVRFIPNPYYVQSLKKLTGNNKKVQNFIMSHPESRMFADTVDKLINDIIPCYIREGKYHLNIAFGCTGGQHRSVTMANEFAERFKKQGKRITLEHRDI